MASARARRITEAYGRWSRGVDAPEMPPDDYEFHPPPDLPGEDVYRGPAAMRDFSTAMSESFEWLRIEPLGFEESGSEVLVRVRLTAKGRSSGIDVEREEFHLWSFGPEGPVKLSCFTEREDALAAAAGEFPS